MLELFKGGLQVDHFAWLRGLGTLGPLHHRDVVLLDLLLQEPQLPLHLVAPSHLIKVVTDLVFREKVQPHLVDELPLECVGVGVEVTELDQTKLSEFRHTAVGCL